MDPLQPTGIDVLIRDTRKEAAPPPASSTQQWEYMQFQAYLGYVNHTLDGDEFLRVVSRAVQYARPPACQALRQYQIEGRLSPAADFLNKSGTEKWELVSVLQSPKPDFLHFFLKRPKTPS
jgi:hypothetical protein